MESNSIAELLTWLKVQPRTFGCDAVVAYGRSETNKVLLQEYINRFGTDNYLRPITEEVKNTGTPNSKEYYNNYQLDSPKISFAGSELEKSSAKISMNVVGGSRVHFEKQQGTTVWNVSKLSHEDVLDGEKLSFDVDLIAARGSVSSAGRVELDISNGKNYRLTGGLSEVFNKLAGERMQHAFKSLPEDQKVYVLNELKFDDKQFLKPDQFVIRTHNKKGSGARLLAGEDEGEGAVLVFIAMQGRDLGRPPTLNKDLKYLLPDGYSATLLLGHEFFIKKIFDDGLKKISNSQSIVYEEVRSADKLKILKLIAKSGQRTRRQVEQVVVKDITYKSIYTTAYTRFHSEKDYFSLNTSDGKLSVEWKEPDIYQPLSENGFDLTQPIWVDWDINVLFDYVIGENQDFRIEVSPESRYQINCKASSQYYFYPEVLQAYNQWMRRLFDEAITDFIGSAQSINVFTLNSLLFRGTDAVQFKRAEFPTDVALFGHVGPGPSGFSINQVQQLVGPGETFQFTTQPSRTDLKWEVHNILGETDPKGSINPTTGLYTAPTGAQLKGSFVRVRVTASAGGRTSSALVTVLRQAITVNPMIRVATAGDTLALDVSAGTVDGGPLTWSIQDPSSGAVVRPHPNTDPAERKDHVYVPGPRISRSPPTVDTIVVHNPRTKLSETARVLVLHRGITLNVGIVEKPGLPDNQFQLAILGEEGPINPGDFEETWEVVLGGGSAQIDAEKGLLTVNPAGPDKYVLVTVCAPGIRNQPDDYGYLILPVPFFSLPPETLRQLLSTDAQ